MCATYNRPLYVTHFESLFRQPWLTLSMKFMDNGLVALSTEFLAHWEKPMKIYTHGHTHDASAWDKNYGKILHFRHMPCSSPSHTPSPHSPSPVPVYSIFLNHPRNVCVHFTHYLLMELCMQTLTQMSDSGWKMVTFKLKMWIRVIGPLIYICTTILNCLRMQQQWNV